MNPGEPEESFLTVAEVAEMLKLNQQTVRNWIDQGSLPAVRVGRRVRIKRSDFERVLDQGYTSGPPPGMTPGRARRTSGAASRRRADRRRRLRRRHRQTTGRVELPRRPRPSTRADHAGRPAGRHGLGRGDARPQACAARRRIRGEAAGAVRSGGERAGRVGARARGGPDVAPDPGSEERGAAVRASRGNRPARAPRSCGRGSTAAVRRSTARSPARAPPGSPTGSASCGCGRRAGRRDRRGRATAGRPARATPPEQPVARGRRVTTRRSHSRGSLREVQIAQALQDIYAGRRWKSHNAAGHDEGGDTVPQIIVVADRGATSGQGP